MAGKDDLSADQLVAMGTIFIGAGVALFVSTGPAMLGPLGLGLIMLLLGLRRRGDEQRTG